MKQHNKPSIDDVISVIHNWMWFNSTFHFMSTADCSVAYGKSRQHWEKLMRTGKLQYQQTKAGKITTSYWVAEYLNSRKDGTT